ncbi:methylated-DNA--[protein]-cysteine S-methyltransferase [Candidatus Dependentiae bacterium]|nr:methylated-DNA--[protein]-cysteine S-methyltransferase [Candidatus Dependentiae bacterium]
MNFKINFVAPKEAKSYLQNNKIFYSYYQTAAGKILVLSADKGIFKATFDDHELEKYKNAIFVKNLDTSKILLIGTDFQTKVWKSLLQISTKSISYQELANKIGQPKSYRAVANALGQNNIAYFIPCHKVVRKNGELGGYKWGIEKKIKLLETANIL